jgi:hypothetical protein
MRILNEIAIHNKLFWKELAPSCIMAAGMGCGPSYKDFEGEGDRTASRGKGNIEAVLSF